MPAKKSTNVFDNKHLLTFVERIEKLNSDLDAINADLREIWNEAKSVGFDPKYIKKVIKARKQDPDKLSEDLELTKMYFNACNIQLSFDF